HLTPAEEGGYVVTFRDLPEAITEGDDKADALEQASDCLEVVLALYMRERRRIPEPSAPQRGEYLVGPGSLMAAKTALYIALAKSGRSQRDRARESGTSRRACNGSSIRATCLAMTNLTPRCARSGDA